jgi:hypothetical protein
VRVVVSQAPSPPDDHTSLIKAFEKQISNHWPFRLCRSIHPCERRSLAECARPPHPMLNDAALAQSSSNTLFYSHTQHSLPHG